MMCELAKNYFLKHGDIKLPIKFNTFDGCVCDNDGYALGLWVAVQKKLVAKNQVAGDKIKKLREVGIISDEDMIEMELQLLLEYVEKHGGNRWDFMYSLAKEYYGKNGNLNIPGYFRTLDGYTEYTRGWELGKWIVQQSEDLKNGKLTDDQFIKLKEIKFENTPNDFLWNNIYDLAKKYYEHYGNLDMGYGFVTINGIDYNENGINLGYWLNHQKKKILKGTLDPYQKKLLQEIGIKIYDNYFEYMYERAKRFYDEHGHLNVRMNNSNATSLTFDEAELLRWKEDCKKAKRDGKLDEKTSKRLENIGVFLTSREADWNNMYTIAKLYSNHHLSLNIPGGFKTFDGVEYDENGFELGKWLNNQVANLKQGKLSEDRIKKLNDIGMIWAIRNNKEENKNICLEYGIDYELNKNIIKRIPTMILVSKINFLLYNLQSITTDGKLHEIFSMSSVDINLKYGLSLEEIVNKFYDHESRKRVL